MVLYNQAKQCTDDAGVTPLSHPKAKEKFISEDATWKEKDDTCDPEAVKVKKNIRDVLSLSC